MTSCRHAISAVYIAQLLWGKKNLCRFNDQTGIGYARLDFLFLVDTVAALECLWSWNQDSQTILIARSRSAGTLNCFVSDTSISSQSPHLSPSELRYSLWMGQHFDCFAVSNGSSITASLSVHRFINWFVDWSTDLLIDWLTDWLTGWLIAWFIYLFMYLLIYWLNDWLIHLFIDSLIHCLIHWKIHLLIDWLIDRFIHSLIHSLQRLISRLSTQTTLKRFQLQHG